MSVKHTSIPHYIHKINPRLKYIYLSFDSSGQLVVKSPKVPQKEIERVLLKKIKWIESSRIKISQKRGKSLQGNSEDRLYYMGKEYMVNYMSDANDINRIVFDKERGACIYVEGLDTEDIERAVNEFYAKEARERLPMIVDRYADIMGLYPTKLSFRKAKRQWGSCSGKNAISLNYLMMKLPIETIEYIIVHELAHIKHKHHQESFWELVGSHMPDYKSRRKVLKTYTL